MLTGQKCGVDAIPGRFPGISMLESFTFLRDWSNLPELLRSARAVHFGKIVNGKQSFP